VGLPGGDELIIDAEMDLDPGGAEPAATPALEMARLPHSGHAEEACVERLGLRLAAGRHRKLDVVARSRRRGPLPDAREGSA
jgi:hypothetical protein